MQLSPRIRTFGGQDQTWLASDHGTNDARSVTLSLNPAVSGFVQANHHPNGFLPDGIPLARISAGVDQGLYGLYDDAVAARNVFVGFLFLPASVPATGVGVRVDGAALLDHCQVLVARLPFAVDAAGQADAAGRIVFRA
jgi:hypothetical protein